MTDRFSLSKDPHRKLTPSEHVQLSRSRGDFTDTEDNYMCEEDWHAPVPPRPPRVRVQAMLSPDVAELLKSEALRRGVSLSAMAAMLIKAGLRSDLMTTSSNPITVRLSRILALAEREGLLEP